MDCKYLAEMARRSDILPTGTIPMEISGEPRFRESAYVMITCEDCSEPLIESLLEISEIKEIQATCGNYDVIVKIEADSVESLKQVIDYKIRAIQKIRATTTLVSSPVLVY